ncbi:MAG: hypothetical protein JWM10_4336 [Myxococcaceae bacterium]|nr:hypothetical protein [Myxococcaceae bacterium]
MTGGALLPASRAERVALVAVVGFLVAVAFHYTHIVRGEIYPGGTYLFRPAAATSDAHAYYDQCRSLNPYLSVPPTATRPYPPFGYLFGHPLTWLPRGASIALTYLLAVLGGLWFMNHHVARGPEADRRVWALVAFLVSYPLHFVLDRGNPEMITALLYFAFVTAYAQRRTWLAATLLAVVASIKVTPLVLLALFVGDRRHREAAYAVGLAGLLTLTALVVFARHAPAAGVAGQLDGLRENLRLFGEKYSRGREGLFANHSLFGAIKFVAMSADVMTWRQVVDRWFAPWQALSAVVCAGVGGYAAFVERALWRRITLLGVLVLALPHASHDYKLLQLFAPIALYLRSERDESDARVLPWIFGLLLVPMAYPAIEGYRNVTVGVLVRPLLLVLLALWVIRDGGLARARLPVRGATAS